MDALIVFNAENFHPLHRIMHRDRRHVWCAIRDKGRGHWVGYDWGQGSPRITCLAKDDYDLAGFYLKHGYEVIETHVKRVPPRGPLMLNNCVGHVKLLLGIRSWALTPHQLYRHLKREKKRMGIFDRLLGYFVIPGFGGGAPSPPPPPPPPEPPKPVARKTDESVQQARRDEQRRARIAAGQGGTIKTPLGGVGDATTTKTLLGQ